MSIVRLDMIWQPEAVLPYLLHTLKAKVETITPVKAMYLFGSRSRVGLDQWHTLEGKDWDIYIVCDFPIVNTRIWGRDIGYYLDIVITTQKRIDTLLQANGGIKQLFPEDTLDLKSRYMEEALITKG